MLGGRQHQDRFTGDHPGGYSKGNVVKTKKESAAILRSLYLIEEQPTEQIGPR